MYGCELWALDNTAIDDFSWDGVKDFVRKICGVPFAMHPHRFVVSVAVGRYLTKFAGVR